MNICPTSLSDSALLAETVRATVVERSATADLLALLAEVDRRKLYLGLGYSSLFVYCTQVLRLSEPAAYSRITAARLSRKFPGILPRLAAGDVALTAVTLLAAHLTEDNHEALLDAARHKSKREIECLVAQLDPQPDVPSVIRRLPAPVMTAPNVAASLLVADDDGVAQATGTASRTSLLELPQTSTPQKPTPPLPVPTLSVVAPLSAIRYLLKVTLSDEGHANLERSRALLRHAIPSGDPALVIERALAVLRETLERTRQGDVRRPRARPRPSSPTSRHVPAEVRRSVWRRDGGQCAFVGTDGRCGTTAFLEVHHVVPFARGGPATVENLELRCRAHNAHEAERDFGPRRRSASA